MPKKQLVPGNFDLAVKRSSAGLGLFAREAIPRKACVIEYTGVLLTPEQYQASNSRYLFDVGRNKTIDGAPRWNKARYINHSCRPNCDIEIQKGRVFIQARRNIKPGEELSYDYGEEYFDEYIGDNCRCLKCQPAEPVKAIAKATGRVALKSSRKSSAKAAAKGAGSKSGSKKSPGKGSTAKPSIKTPAKAGLPPETALETRIAA